MKREHERVWTKEVHPAVPDVQAATLLGKEVLMPYSASPRFHWQNESTDQKCRLLLLEIRELKDQLRLRQLRLEPRIPPPQALPPPPHHSYAR